jgi:serine/threonine protein phosphatase PrpC
MILILEDKGGREYMEDRISFEREFHNDYDFYAIFDGHGGAEVASYLSLHMKTVVKELLETNEKHGSLNIDVPQLLHTAFDIIVQNIPLIISTHTGSTAIVILKRNQDVWVANCGDSRAIMNIGYDAIPLTYDHKPTRHDEYIRITQIGGKIIKTSPEDCYRVNGVLAVSRAVGDFSLSPHITWKPEIHHYTLTKSNAYIFMATDGIWDVLSNVEVVTIINNCYLAKQHHFIGKELVGVARQRGSTDNIAFLIVPLHV